VFRWIGFAKQSHSIDIVLDCGLALRSKANPSDGLAVLRKALTIVMDDHCFAKTIGFFLRIGFASESLSIVKVWLCLIAKPANPEGKALLRDANLSWCIGFSSQNQPIEMDWLALQSQSVVVDWLCFAKPILCDGMALLRKAIPS
jgi:hypothetical protein